MANAIGGEAEVWVSGYDLSPYLRDASMSESVDALDSTTFEDAQAGAKTYAPGLGDATLSKDGIYQAGDESADPEEIANVLNDALGGESVWTMLPQGDGFGNFAYGLRGVQTSVEVTAPVAELVGIAAEAQATHGREPLEVLHPMGQEAASGDGTTLDNGALSPNGGVGYLQVEDVSPTETLAVTVQHSDDDVIFVDLVTFTVANGRAAERAEVAGQVEQYVQAEWVLSGGSGTFQVAFGRK